MNLSMILGLGARSVVGGFDPNTLALPNIGAVGVTEGFSALSAVTSYTATADRFRRAASGFVRCAANEERLCYNADGTFRGQYLQGADTYNSAPWDDVAAPHTSGDPAFLTTSAGGTIAYAGAHSEADIFGGTGKGVVLTQTATANGFHTASNLTTSVVLGDVCRLHAIVSISGASGASRVDLRGAGQQAFAFSFDHDASGNITGFTETWTTRRAGFFDMGTINGKRWWYLWVDVRNTGAGNQQVGLGFSSLSAQTGRKIHVCELMIQKNPATPPAAVPVCKANATFAADTLNTAFADAGYVCEGLAMARSQIIGGAIIPPAVNIGVPYEPLETRIEIALGAEAADRSGIMPNPNQVLYGRAWQTPTTLPLTFGPGWFARDWYKGNATGEAATNLTVRSVFQNREDLRPILGNMATSNTYITGAIDIDGVVLMAGGDTRTKYIEQSDILVGTGSSFFFVAGTNVSVTNCLTVGSTLYPTRARHLVQQDDTDDQRVYMGELTLQSATGGAISLKGTRTHNLARATATTTAAGTSVTLDTDQLCATQFWMDLLFIAQGTYTSWTGDQMFGALTTARRDMFLCQSERPIRISTTGEGGTFSDLSPSFDERTMPHGHLAEHIGTWNFDTNTFTSAPDPAKALRVRYWVLGSAGGLIVNKPGFQWIASQMDMGTHSRFPTSGDVFRIRNGSQIIDVTYQGGEWRSGGYTRYAGAAANNPALLEHLVSNDFIQINRNSVTAQTSVTLDGNVFIGPKGGYFLTGDPALGASGSNLDNFTVTNTLVMSEGTNGLRWDHSRVNPADCSVSNALFIEAASDYTFNDGTGKTLTIGGAGANNVLTFGSNVTVLGGKVGGGLEAAQAGATYVGTVTTVVTGQRTAFDTWSAPDAKVPQYLPAEFYAATQGRGLLPAPGRIFDFDLEPFADTDAGFGVRAIITAAKGTHARWNAVISDLKAKFHKVPDLVVSTANTASVGTNLGAATGVIDRIEGGDIDRFFEVVSGQLQVRRALTGLNRVFMLRTTTGQLLIVDVTA